MTDEQRAMLRARLRDLGYCRPHDPEIDALRQVLDNGERGMYAETRRYLGGGVMVTGSAFGIACPGCGVRGCTREDHRSAGE